jgi:hypothetical protein
MIREMTRRGFSKGETKAALEYLLNKGVLEQSSNGVKLS